MTDHPEVGAVPLGEDKSCLTAQCLPRVSMVKKLEWIEMARLATVLSPVGKERARKKK